MRTLALESGVAGGSATVSLSRRSSLTQRGERQHTRLWPVAVPSVVKTVEMGWWRMTE